MNDPNIHAARAIVKMSLAVESHKRCHCRDKIDAGEWDSSHTMRAALIGIAYGEMRQTVTTREKVQP